MRTIGLSFAKLVLLNIVIVGILLFLPQIMRLRPTTNEMIVGTIALLVGVLGGMFGAFIMNFTKLVLS